MNGVARPVSGRGVGIQLLGAQWEHRKGYLLPGRITLRRFVPTRAASRDGGCGEQEPDKAGCGSDRHWPRIRYGSIASDGTGATTTQSGAILLRQGRRINRVIQGTLIGPECVPMANRVTPQPHNPTTRSLVDLPQRFRGAPVLTSIPGTTNPGFSPRRPGSAALAYNQPCPL